MIYQSIETLLADRSDTMRYKDKRIAEDVKWYKKVAGIDAYNMLLCTMLYPPTSKEIKEMPIGMKKIAQDIVDEKERAVKHVQYMFEKDLTTRAYADDLANYLSNNSYLDNSYIKKWDVSERQYYRLKTKADKLLLKNVCHAMFAIDDAIKGDERQ